MILNQINGIMHLNTLLQSKPFITRCSTYLSAIILDHHQAHFCLPEIADNLKKKIGESCIINFRQIFYFSVASTDDSAFVIGGSPLSGVIAQFKDDAWSLYGNLKKRRFGHSTITYDDTMIVFGGRSTDAR